MNTLSVKFTTFMLARLLDIISTAVALLAYPEYFTEVGLFSRMVLKYYPVWVMLVVNFMLSVLIFKLFNERLVVTHFGDVRGNLVLVAITILSFVMFGINMFGISVVNLNT